MVLHEWKRSNGK
ncbi:hypothetical protein SAMN02745158_04066 [Lactonifactor longoviformis DSM 17459]|uniref:Uncharacterized protein n=1 Tax=Lactonifactor longoviformis DSM 17459 TaxID=1122155 RepID=A0A1M5CBF8_9CLOT|nr:hypothetical protein SAMN02745158_04066 [Lactonifactor longoviformis DSM 17459]